MPSTTYTLCEAGHTIEADVRYTVHPAYGDNRCAPYEPAHVEVLSARLFRRRTPLRLIDGKYRHVVERTDLGDAPDWVIDMLCDDEDWQNEILADYFTEPEYEREDY